jgi:Tfp pilus assembly protein PilX
MIRMTTNNQQQGIVSILVCLIMMIVISLVVLGFSQVARNNLTQTLNRQLSSEAFYAADSGINNATSIIDEAEDNGQTPASVTNSCSSSTYTSNAQLDSSSVAYTCVNVNANPTSLQYQVPAGTSTVFPVDVGTGHALTSISFSWNDASGDGTNYDGCPNPNAVGTFPPAADWSTSSSPCDASVLQIDMISGFESATALGQETSADSIYVSPAKGGQGQSGTLTNGAVYRAKCQDGSECTVTITGLQLLQQIYYVRVTPLYADTTLNVCANEVASDCTQSLYGAQADVDSTGRAQDVLQRLDARVSLSSLSGGNTTTATAPLTGIQTGDSLCKLIEGYPGGTATVGVEDNSSSDPGCQL